MLSLGHRQIVAFMELRSLLEMKLYFMQTPSQDSNKKLHWHNVMLWCWDRLTQQTIDVQERCSKTYLVKSRVLWIAFQCRLCVRHYNGRVFLQSWRWDPPKLSRKIRLSPRTILENFSAVDTQTAVLVSTAEVWISAPDTQTPTFLGFLGIHSWLRFFLPGDENFRIFSWGACHENQGLSTSSV